MTFKAAIQRIEVHVKSDSGHKPAKRQLTEEELEARRRINRIRMAATRAARTLEQIEADRMSQRARMAALRRRRSEQEIKSVLGEPGTPGEVDVVGVSRNDVSIEPRVRRNSSSSRRQLTPEELEIRRRINRLRVAMMRAERTEEQIEADRKAQRLRMAELRRRRSEEQIAADLESQRARMAALRRERRRLREEGGTPVSGDLCTPVVKQEMEEEQPSHQPAFTPMYADASQSTQSTGCSVGHWTNSGAPGSMSDPYVNGSVPVSLSPRSPPPPHFLPHHLQHHHPVSSLPDVSSVVASSEGGGSSSMGESASQSQQQQPPPPLAIHMPCLQPPPPHAPLPNPLGPPFPPRGSLGPCDWSQPRQHLMGYEGFPSPLHAAAIATSRPLEES
ncbi:protein enabled homolog isoform X2 [Hetaerina americana]|uniref:protein enabled homolog isoform X2 n=1 Tax=Hetaerina americana TaxID=62018 RepID=UPI003A7F3073